MQCSRQLVAWAYSLVVAFAIAVLVLPLAPASAGDATPVVTIANPIHGQAVSGKNVSIVVTYSSEAKRTINKLELLIDGRSNFSEQLERGRSWGSSTYVWDTTLFSDGMHSLAVKATDSANAVGMATVSIYVANNTVDRSAPIVSIISPSPNSIVRGKVPVLMQAVDNVGVAWVLLFIDDKFESLMNYPPYSYIWDTTKPRFPNGAHTLLAKAFDAAENQGISLPVTVTVDNPGGRTMLAPTPQRAQSTPGVASTVVPAPVPIPSKQEEVAPKAVPSVSPQPAPVEEKPKQEPSSSPKVVAVPPAPAPEPAKEKASLERKPIETVVSPGDVPATPAVVMPPLATREEVIKQPPTANKTENPTHSAVLRREVPIQARRAEPVAPVLAQPKESMPGERRGITSSIPQDLGTVKETDVVASFRNQEKKEQAQVTSTPVLNSVGISSLSSTVQESQAVAGPLSVARVSPSTSNDLSTPTTAVRREVPSISAVIGGSSGEAQQTMSDTTSKPVVPVVASGLISETPSERRTVIAKGLDPSSGERNEMTAEAVSQPSITPVQTSIASVPSERRTVTRASVVAKQTGELASTVSEPGGIEAVKPVVQSTSSIPSRQSLPMAGITQDKRDAETATPEQGPSLVIQNDRPRESRGSVPTERRAVVKEIVSGTNGESERSATSVNLAPKSPAVDQVNKVPVLVKKPVSDDEPLRPVKPEIELASPSSLVPTAIKKEQKSEVPQERRLVVTETPSQEKTQVRLALAPSVPESQQASTLPVGSMPDTKQKPVSDNRIRMTKDSMSSVSTGSSLPTVANRNQKQALPQERRQVISEATRPQVEDVRVATAPSLSSPPAFSAPVKQNQKQALPQERRQVISEATRPQHKEARIALAPSAHAQETVSTSTVGRVPVLMKKPVASEFEKLPNGAVRSVAVSVPKVLILEKKQRLDLPQARRVVSRKEERLAPLPPLNVAVDDHKPILVAMLPKTTAPTVRTMEVTRDEKQRHTPLRIAAATAGNLATVIASAPRGGQPSEKIAVKSCSKKVSPKTKRHPCTAIKKAQLPRTQYQVQQGDTLYEIAEKYGVSSGVLCAVNGLGKRKVVKVGQTLTIPQRPVQVWFNKNHVNFDVTPYMRSGLALGPFRHIFECTGGQVFWFAHEKQVKANNNTKEVELTIGSDKAMVNHNEVTMDLAAFLLGGRTIVPIRFFKDALEVNMQWDSTTGRISLTSK